MSVFKLRFPMGRLNFKRLLLSVNDELHRDLTRLIAGLDNLEEGSLYFTALTAQLQSLDVLQWLISQWKIHPKT